MAILFLMKKGIIFLTSTGLSNEKVRKVFVEEIGKAGRDKSVVIITTDSEEKENNKYCQLAFRQLREIGFEKIDFVDLEAEPNKDFSEYDVIYVSGGNTFRLLKFCREANFKKSIDDLLARGGIYIGVSAGSCLMCSTIEMGLWKEKNRDQFGLSDLTAFNFVPFLLFVHYESSHFEVIKDASLDCQYPIRILTDQQAFLVKDGVVNLIGDGEETKL